MAFDTVGLVPSLMPWQRAGVEFLLAQEAVPDIYSLCSTSQPPAASVPTVGIVPRPAAVARPAEAAVVRPAEAAVARPAEAAVVRPAEAAVVRPAVPDVTPSSGGMRPSSAASAHSAHNARTAPSSPERDRGDAGVPPASLDSPFANSALIPPDQWPAPWRQRLSKTAPATVLWTYWSLGEDLSGHPNPERRTLLQRLLADLGHPAGTHSFWPAALPDPDISGPPSTAPGQESPETLLCANPQIFWSGVHALKARALVVMGSPAAKALELPPRLRPFQQTRHNGRLVVVLRDVDFLVQEVQRYDAVREFLRQALQPFVARS